jgi:hypothetical protein
MAARKWASGRVRVWATGRASSQAEAQVIATLWRRASAICPSGLLLSKLCRSWSKTAWARLKAKVCWAEARTLLESTSERSCVSSYQSSGSVVRAACQVVSSAARWGPSKGRSMVGPVFKAAWACAAGERPCWQHRSMLLLEGMYLITCSPWLHIVHRLRS